MLASKIDELHIPVLENQTVSRLLVRDGVCFGCWPSTWASGERMMHLADAVNPVYRRPYTCLAAEFFAP